MMVRTCFKKDDYNWVRFLKKSPEKNSDKTMQTSYDIDLNANNQQKNYKKFGSIQTTVD